MRTQSSVLLSALALAVAVRASYFDDEIYDIYARDVSDDFDLYARDLEAELDFLEAREAEFEYNLEAREADSDFGEELEFFEARDAEPEFYDDEMLGMLYGRWAEADANAIVENVPPFRIGTVEQTVVPGPNQQGKGAPGQVYSGPGFKGKGKGGKGKKGKGKSNKACAVYVNGVCQSSDPSKAPTPAKEQNKPAPVGAAPATTTTASEGYVVVNQAGA